MTTSNTEATKERKTSKPITCVVIDGWHHGHTIEMPNPPHQLSLIRPRVVTIDDCCPPFDEVFTDTMHKDILTYVAAFKSFDGEVVLYSTDGSSKEFTNSSTRQNWFHKDGYEQYDQPLYVNMHDPRAVYELSESMPEE